MEITELSVAEYLEFVKKTDRLPENELHPVLHGLFGEVGGLMSAAKKMKREPDSYTGFDSEVIEEFGDAFWYLCCLSLRIKLDIHSILLDFVRTSAPTHDLLIGSRSRTNNFVYKTDNETEFDATLIELGQITGDFLNAEYIFENPENKIISFLKSFFATVDTLNVKFSSVINFNVKKVSGRFIRPKNESLPTFDEGFPEFEQLPYEFEIEFMKRTENHLALRWNGVFIGDPLTDSSKDKDGYRFHDVFHFSHAAILHWSPTFRWLIKQKRKSKPEMDHDQDGGRAIVVEEGLSAWVFNIAKQDNKYFEGKESLTFDMLKNVGQFVKGFEVESCPLILWEEAILKGYEVFREIKKNQGGIVIGSRNKRTITYKKS